MPQHSDLRLSWSKVLVYANNRLEKINYIDINGLSSGYLELTYGADGKKIIKMKELQYDRITFVNVNYQYPMGYTQINFEYLFSNGLGMNYTLKIKGGNKSEDSATASNGISGESSTYQYDFNINPYAHLNLPNIYLSNLSKNNMVAQYKVYSGSIPSSEPYKFEYLYDDGGYPKELLSSYKNYLTGEHLYKVKTVYTY